MSVAVQEDNELCDLVSQTLESAGVLAKIRAELRASVFLVLEEHEAFKGRNISLTNNPLKDFLSTSEGIIIVSLVREFLDYFGLEFTASVFEPEVQSGKSYEYKGRNKLAQALKLNPGAKGPMLAQVFQQSKVNHSVPEANINKEQIIKNKTEKDEKSNQNNVHFIAESKGLTVQPSNYVKSPGRPLEEVSGLDGKPSAMSSPSSFQSVTKKVDNTKNLRPEEYPLSSLESLPPLGLAQHDQPNKTSNKSTKQVSTDIKSILDISCNMRDQNYEDDFLPSGSEKLSRGTNRSLSGSGSEVEEEVSIGMDDPLTDVSDSHISEKANNLL